MIANTALKIEKDPGIRLPEINALFLLIDTTRLPSSPVDLTEKNKSGAFSSRVITDLDR